MPIEMYSISGFRRISARGIRPTASAGISGCAIHSSIAKQPAMPKNQRQHDRFDIPESAVLKVQHQEHVGRRKTHTPEQGNVEEQLQCDSGAEDLREVACRNRYLAQDPQHERRPRRIGGAARLREVAAAGDAEARGERLQQNRHQVGEHDDAQQRVPELRAAGNVGGPVARVHVADRHQITRPRERQHLFPRRAGDRDRDTAVNLGKAAAIPLGVWSDDGGGLLHQLAINSIMISRVASTASPPRRPVAHRQLHRIGRSCRDEIARPRVRSRWNHALRQARKHRIARAGGGVVVRYSRPGRGKARVGRHRPGGRASGAPAGAVHRVAADGGTRTKRQ